MSEGKNIDRQNHRFPYEWTLKDAVFTKDKGTVFSCFACGGGSTMGYKLAGFDVLGCNEIDPKMMEAYITNHKPKYSYLEPIQSFKLGRIASKLYYERWTKREKTDTSFGDITQRLNGSGSCFSDVFAKDELPLPTITSKGGIYDFENGHFISDDSFKKGGTYPLDYDFKGNKIPYLVGMSVPPVMTAQIATEIYNQWLCKS